MEEITRRCSYLTGFTTTGCNCNINCCLILGIHCVNGQQQQQQFQAKYTTTYFVLRYVSPLGIAQMTKDLKRVRQSKR